MPYFATQTSVTFGGGPRGDGFVVVTALPGVRPTPLVSYNYCQNANTPQAYSVPGGAHSLQMLVNGAGGGSDPNSRATGGGGASVQATMSVTPGQKLSAVVGCQGTEFAAGAGYSSGGKPGGVSNADPGDSGASGGGSSAVLNSARSPLVIAGAGGGSGGLGEGGNPGSGGDGSLTGGTGGNAGGPRSGGGGGGAGSAVGTGTNGGGTNCPYAGTGGGGGAGLKGGGGGGSGLCLKGVNEPGSGGGGGGGSSTVAAALTAGTVTAGTAHGDGAVIFVALVPGVPTTPTLVQATGSPLTGTVSFQPPVDDGGSPVTSYTVTAHPGGATATGTTSPIVVTGLSAQKPYTFTVHATNAIGDSAEGGPSNPVTTVFTPARRRSCRRLPATARRPSRSTRQSATAADRSRPTPRSRGRAAAPVDPAPP